MKINPQDNRIRDITYLTRADSGASVDYGKGAIVGAVGSLVACGMDGKKAVEYVLAMLPSMYRVECIPLTFRDALPRGIESAHSASH